MLCRIAGTASALTAAAFALAAAAPAHAAKIEHVSRPGKLSYFAFVEKAEKVRSQPKASARTVSKLTKKSPEGTDDLVLVLDRTTVKKQVWLRVQVHTRRRPRRIVLRPGQEKLLNLLRDHGSLAPREIWRALKLSKQGAMDLMRPLIDAGLIVKRGTKKSGRYRLNTT